MAGVVPPPGDLYTNPPIPPDYVTDPQTVANAVPNHVLATSHAVTTGPDRNLYWVYGHNLPLLSHTSCHSICLF